MNGIFGIINFDGKPVRQEELVKMREAISHRGRDGSGFWLDGAAGMGQLVTHITPESVYEQLPYVCPESRRVITADARLDNREELFERLAVPHPERKETPDSRLILKAYDTWGESCPDYLLGEFTFVIGDTRSKTLFCARDHMGARPFFYYHSTRRFIFASEGKSIRTLPGVPVQLNETKMAMKLLPLEQDHEQTMFKDIMRLKCANTLVLKNNRIYIRPYWHPRPPDMGKSPSPVDYAAVLRQLVVDSVHCRLRLKPGLQVGITLSGGLDSSTIAWIAARRLQEEGKRLVALSSVLPPDYKGIESDERQYIREVVEQENNIDIHYVTAEGLGPFDDLETSFNRSEGTARSFHYMVNVLGQTAESRGVNVLLTGNGGDQMASFDGRDAVYLAARQFRLLKALKLSRQLSEIESIPLAKILKRRLFLPLLPDWFLKFYSYYKEAKRQDRFIPDTPVSFDFARKYGFKPRQLVRGGFCIRDQRANLLKKIESGKFIIDSENTRLSYYGITGLFPFLDKRILEFFLGVPPEQYLIGGWNRSLLRRAMEGILPPVIQWRKDKHPFTPDFHRRVMSAKQEIIDVLNSIKENDPVRDYIDIDRIKDQFQRVRPVKGRESWETKTQTVVVQGFIVLKFLQWIKNKNS